jgi:hypothetical protein
MHGIIGEDRQVAAITLFERKHWQAIVSVFVSTHFPAVNRHSTTALGKVESNGLWVSHRIPSSFNKSAIKLRQV